MGMVDNHLNNFKKNQDKIVWKMEEFKIYTEIEPKVINSYNPIPGRVPRKVDIERNRIQY